MKAGSFNLHVWDLKCTTFHLVYCEFDSVTMLSHIFSGMHNEIFTMRCKYWTFLWCLSCNILINCILTVLCCYLTVAIAGCGILFGCLCVLHFFMSHSVVLDRDKYRCGTPAINLSVSARYYVETIQHRIMHISPSLAWGFTFSFSKSREPNPNANRVVGKPILGKPLVSDDT